MIGLPLLLSPLWSTTTFMDAAFAPPHGLSFTGQLTLPNFAVLIRLAVARSCVGFRMD